MIFEITEFNGSTPWFLIFFAAFLPALACAESGGAERLVQKMNGSFGVNSHSACPDYAALQAEINKVESTDYKKYRATGDTAGFKALERLDAAFDKVLEEVRTTVVTNEPAVWFLYNMGFIVKTPETCFSIDILHVRDTELAPLLDFALITHNHDDHYNQDFYQAMNGKGKTVISNFLDNYTAYFSSNTGGFTRANKTFKIKDVEIKTSLSDHNGYLADFTTAFEITIGGKYRIYHSGDSANIAKLNPAKNPDMWIVHPRCGLGVASGVEKFQPKLTVIAHLNEMGHPVNKWRWTWQNGLEDAAAVEKADGKAAVPVWGERVPLF